MKGLRSCPAASIDSQYSTDLPLDSIGYQNLLWFFVVLVLPQNHYPYFMIHSRYLDRLGEIPLPFFANQYFFARLRSYPLGNRLGFEFLPHKDHVPVELQIAHISTILFVYIIGDRRIAEIAVECEVTWYLLFHHPIDQFLQ